MTEHPVRLLKRFTGSLSFKLSFYAGLIMFLAIVAFAYFSIRSQERNLITKMIQVALKDSEVVKAAIWNGMMTNDKEVIRGIVRAIGASGGFEEINIFDRSGVLRYSSHTDLTQRLQPEPNPLLGEIVTDESTRHQISDDGKWLYVVNPIRNTQSCFTAACHAHPENVKVLGSLAIKLPWEGVRAELYENVRRTVVLAFLLFLMISTSIGLTT